jgi:hypothetical protein
MISRAQGSDHVQEMELSAAELDRRREAGEEVRVS